MKWITKTSAAVVCAVALGACGSSSKSTSTSGSGAAATSSSAGSTSSASNASSTSAASAGTSKLKGSAIPILATGTFSGTTNPDPQMQEGIQSAVDAVNASGGIKGHALKLTICNDQDNPNDAQSCAQQAVSQHDVAVVSGGDTLSQSVIPTLAQSKIPLVDGIAATEADVTSPVAFPLAPGGYNGNGAVAIAAKAAGCKNAVTMTAIIPGVTAAIEASMVQGLVAAHIPVVKKLNVSLTEANFAPLVAAATAAHGDCLATVVAEPQTPGLMAQVRETGNGMKLLVLGINLPPLNALKGVGNGDYVYSFSSVPGESGGPAGLTTVNTDLSKYAGSSASISPASYDGFGSVLLLSDALKKVKGAYTAKTVLASLNNLKDASTDGIYPPYTDTKASGIKGEARSFNPDGIAFKINGTSMAPVGNFEPIPGL